MYYRYIPCEKSSSYVKYIDFFPSKNTFYARKKAGNSRSADIIRNHDINILFNGARVSTLKISFIEKHSESPNGMFSKHCYIY